MKITVYSSSYADCFLLMFQWLPRWFKNINGTELNYKKSAKNIKNKITY